MKGLLFNPAQEKPLGGIDTKKSSAEAQTILVISDQELATCIDYIMLILVAFIQSTNS